MIKHKWFILHRIFHCKLNRMTGPFHKVTVQRFSYFPHIYNYVIHKINGTKNKENGGSRIYNRSASGVLIRQPGNRIHFISK